MAALPPTIKQIAEACGVSRPTANLILNNKGDRYSPATRRKVRAAARQLGYRPNAAARATRTGRFNAFGLLLSTDYGKGRLTEPLFHGLRKAMRHRGLHLIVGDLPDERLQSDKDLPRILREWSVDGLLVNYTHAIPPRMLDLIGREKLPAVWLNTQLEHNCVYPDDLGAGRRAATELLQRGHRRIAYVTGPHPAGHYSYRDRYEGYAQAMADAGLSPAPLGYREPERFPLVERVRAMLGAPQRPSAVIVYGYDAAITVLMTAASHGLRAPDDLALVVFHHEQASIAGMALATLEIDGAAMSTAAVEMLAHRAEAGGDCPPVVLPLQWRSGASIGLCAAS